MHFISLLTLYKERWLLGYFTSLSHILHSFACIQKYVEWNRTSRTTLDKRYPLLVISHVLWHGQISISFLFPVLLKYVGWLTKYQTFFIWIDVFFSILVISIFNCQIVQVKYVYRESKEVFSYDKPFSVHISSLYEITGATFATCKKGKKRSNFPF